MHLGKDSHFLKHKMVDNSTLRRRVENYFVASLQKEVSSDSTRCILRNEVMGYFFVRMEIEHNRFVSNKEMHRHQATLSRHAKFSRIQTFGREFKMFSMWHVESRIFGFDSIHGFVRRW